MTKASESDNVVEPEVKRQIELPESMSVRQLSELLGTGSIEIIKQLMRNGIMANINQIISFEAAATIAAGYDYEVSLMSRSARKAAEARTRKQAAPGEDGGNLQQRPPVTQSL